MSEEQLISWILELRARLADPPPRRLAASDARRVAVLVPLYVEAGALWTLLARRIVEGTQRQGQIAFPGIPLPAGEEAWTVALGAAQQELGLEPRRMLRLGELDEFETPSGLRLVPWVGGVPAPVKPQIDRAVVDEIFAVPLHVLAHPTLVEERRVRVGERELTERCYHIGGRRIWGPTARIVHSLLVRLGLAVDEEPVN